jgi:glucosylceramidase
MRIKPAIALAVAALLVGMLGGGLRPSSAYADGQTVSVWLTTDDLANRLTPQPSTAFAADSGTNSLTIDIDEGRVFQTMTGFGASFTDSAAWLVYTKLSSSQRSAVMNDLFNTSSGIGLNMLRQPMGSTDFIKDVGGY